MNIASLYTTAATVVAAPVGVTGGFAYLDISETNAVASFVGAFTFLLLKMRNKLEDDNINWKKEAIVSIINLVLGFSFAVFLGDHFNELGLGLDWIVPPTTFFVLGLISPYLSERFLRNKSWF